MSIDQDLASAIIQDTLKPKHAMNVDVLKFIEHYLTCKHVGQAASLAGLSTADGRYFFNQSDIYDCIQKMLQKHVAKFGFDAEQVVARVKEIGDLDMIGAVDDEGRFIENLHEWPEEIRRCIKKIKMKNYFENDHNGVPQYKGKVLEVEFNDKMKALGMMAAEKDVMKKTTVVQHEFGKNARNYLLNSMRRADDAKAGLKDVTPVQAIDAPAEPRKVVFKKPGGV